MSKRILITGAGGFVGDELARYCSSAGWDVRAFVRSPPTHAIPGVEYVVYDMESGLYETDFEGVDVLVHCAFVRYERHSTADDLNVSATRELIAMCRKREIRPIYLSSFSAHSGATSHYGRNKLKCEQLFDLSRDLVLRPGLVIGKKGLAADMMARIERGGYFPLAGGDKPVQTIAVSDLCRIIERAANTGDSGLYHIAEPRAVTLKALYAEMAAQLGKKITFIPVPLSLLYLGCKLSETLGMALPVSSENVLGLKHLIKYDTTQDLRTLNVPVRNYQENLKLVLK
jgi:nucleoside-diphosphate-sugar epimerase